MSAENIVLVEDDEGMRLAVERLLFARGYPVTAFASAEDLLGWAPRKNARCLILDVRLPGLSGPELRERLAAEGVVAPVIFITAHDDPHTRGRAHAQNPVAYLHKPFEGRQLLDAVARALSLS